jgi:hypothetical protein
MSLSAETIAEARQYALRCVDDFEFFALTCLKIRTKSGDVIPLRLNQAQRHLHQKLEAQVAKRGMVRAIIVKGRQVGISTYIQARFYWNLWRSHRALRAFILTHEDPATENLFGMAKRFHDLIPAHMRPATKAANAKELLFAANDCGYRVATAGTKEVGRSDTIQLFHGSEAAFWPNAESHVKSLLITALAKVAGTEGILESTGNGLGNVFHSYAQAALSGKSEYEAIFVPWFWGEDYQAPCPKTFAETCPPEFYEYGQLHKLTWEQLYWAYLANREAAQAKSLDPSKICSDFRQEYPATFEEAFQSSGNSFIPALSVLRARRPEEEIIGRGPIILGIDPARDQDKVGIIDRCGRRMGQRICETWDPDGNTIYLAQRLAVQIAKFNPDAVTIDVGSNGAGVYDELVDMGYGDKLHPVNFGSGAVGKGPTGERLYANRRAEMWDLMRDWFESPGGVQIPDSDLLHGDLTGPIWGPSATRDTTSNALQLEEKKKIKERIGRSPDLGDAAALTFAVPFASGFQPQTVPKERSVRRRRGGY